MPAAAVVAEANAYEEKRRGRGGPGQRRSQGSIPLILWYLLAAATQQTTRS